MNRIISRVVFAAALTLLVPALASAQSLDLKAGYSYGTLSNKHPDWNNRSGFAAGIGLNTGGVLGLDIEGLYVQKGVGIDGSPSGSTFAPKLDYIDVPVMLKVMLPIPAIQPFVYGGPSVSFRLNCSFNGADCSSTSSSTDYGVVVGAGLRLVGTFTIEARYTWGLKDVNDVSQGVANQTRTFLLLAGLSL